MEHGDLGKEQLEVIVQLGHGADGGARGAHRPALIDGDGRRDALDALDVRLVHAVEKLPGVGGKAFDVAALAFGIEDVEGQRRLSRTADAGDDGQRVERNVEIEILEIVLLGAADVDAIFRLAWSGFASSVIASRYFSTRMRRKREP